MGTVKNVGVSDTLLAAMDAAAKEQGKTADDLFKEAGRLLLDHKGLDALIARRPSYAARAGRKASDAVQAVREAGAGGRLPFGCFIWLLMAQWRLRYRRPS